MPTRRFASRRPGRSPAAAAVLAWLGAMVALSACSTWRPAIAEERSPSAAVTRTIQPTASPTPSPTAAPTPRFTNEADPELAGLIPANIGGVAVVVPPIDQFALTPGDVGLAYGEVGDRFASLALAYVVQPRTTLYAMRVGGAPVASADLEPYLAEAGRYVGIAGLHREPWQMTAVGDHLVWARPEDPATVAGTTVYTWSSGEFVFLLIGVDDALNRALIAALPGEEPPPAATPTPRPAASPRPSP